MKHASKNRKFQITAAAVVVVLGLMMPQKAHAQCETSFSSLPALLDMVTGDLSFINDYINEGLNFVQELIPNTAVFEVSSRLEELDTNVNAWMSDWGSNRLVPAFKGIAAQTSAAKVDQTRNVGSMMDAQAEPEQRGETTRGEGTAARR